MLLAIDNVRIDKDMISPLRADVGKANSLKVTLPACNRHHNFVTTHPPVPVLEQGYEPRTITFEGFRGSLEASSGMYLGKLWFSTEVEGLELDASAFGWLGKLLNPPAKTSKENTSISKR